MRGRDDTHYVDVGFEPPILFSRLPPRADLDRGQILADGEDAAVLSGLRQGDRVTVDGRPVVHEGGDLELTATAPGTYELEITSIRHLPFVTTITATEPEDGGWAPGSLRSGESPA